GQVRVPRVARRVRPDHPAARVRVPRPGMAPAPPRSARSRSRAHRLRDLGRDRHRARPLVVQPALRHRRDAAARTADRGARLLSGHPAVRIADLRGRQHADALGQARL
ncbi:MAG: Lycopene cyclase, partial [uncultured Solirubrobacterales bacterium]